MCIQIPGVTQVNPRAQRYLAGVRHRALRVESSTTAPVTMYSLAWPGAGHRASSFTEAVSKEA